ncbi:transcriptional regulator, LuxR family [Gloeocapsa sp. PCC 7428]|uniref:response regulator transcription factor n=1 Tax=Gloeocapsa sp. PCC 7428 TaxID=1173026 RepID=UPI0002A60403|nr:LuxR C-terminal-related transcriptional regulator [Gloeocapsa sp. PCC 7428]AFZ31646.1 transcriptional regulator, LuxR family [Gloeocapsa sp. PCC 7428]
MANSNWQCDQDGRLELTSQEEKIATLVARGYSNRKIAELIGVSQKTVSKSLRTSYSKLNINNRTELMLVKLGETSSLLEWRYYSSLVNLDFASPRYKKATRNKQKCLRIALEINHLKYKCRFNLVSLKSEWLGELDKLMETIIKELGE